MHCPRCQHENPDDARFCGECAASLAEEIACAACGRINPPQQRFCHGCGKPLAAESSTGPERDPRAYTPKHLADKILQSKSSLEGERKQVTVLFADVKGSMELAEQLDPEEWHAILDRFFTILTEGVHRFEGTVNQYTGDGIMALFGAPIAHEDHAQRACWTALHLHGALRGYADEVRRSHGLSFSTRIGLNSGEVVVGTIGDDLRMDYTAQGHTVGLAARMEQLAAPDHAYLTEHTARLVEGYFTLRDLGPFELKGVSEPVRAYELGGAGTHRTRFEVSQARGFSRFVGRTHELATLEIALAQALEGNGRVVGVVGEAGLGKSRLCHEFLERCRTRGIPVYTAHCPAHGKTLPFFPMLELWRALFGITDRDSEIEARHKIAGTLVLLDDRFQETLPLILDFLGVPDPERPIPPLSPDARQRQIYALMRRQVQARSRREPAVLLIDDAHWIDTASDGLLAQLVAAVPGTCTLLVVNFRPEYQASWMQQTCYEQLRIGPLGPEASATLLSELLGSDPTLAEVARQIQARTGGNPFFIEETVHTLAEGGQLAGTRGAYRLAAPIEAPTLPATVQVVLAARIDRLPPREKMLLQTAAVIGREVPESVLSPVAGLGVAELADGLAHLVRAEFLYEAALYPEAKYAFKHPLTQEVAYASQLAARRVETHAATARTLAATEHDEYAALVAHHWEEAGDALQAAGWRARAAAWTSRGDAATALDHWRAVRRLLETVPQSAETDQLVLTASTAILDLGWRLGLPAEEAATVFADGQAVAQRRDDLRQLAILSGEYGAVRVVAGALAEHLTHGEQAVRMADQTDDLGLRVAMRWRLDYAYFLAGSVRDELRVIGEGLALGAGDVWIGRDICGGTSPYIGLIVEHGIALRDAGRLTDAQAEAERARALCIEHEQHETLVQAHQLSAFIASTRGDGDTALREARRAVELALKLAAPFFIAHAYLALGTAQLAREEWAAALETCEEQRTIMAMHHAGREIEPAGLSLLAHAACGVGDLLRARRAAEDAIAAAQRLGTRGFEIMAQLAHAGVLLRGEGMTARTAVEEALERAGALVDVTGIAIHRPTLHVALAALAALTADETTRGRELGEAHRLFTEMGATGHAERIAKELS